MREKKNLEGIKQSILERNAMRYKDVKILDIKIEEAVEEVLISVEYMDRNGNQTKDYYDRNADFLYGRIDYLDVIGANSDFKDRAEELVKNIRNEFSFKELEKSKEIEEKQEEGRKLLKENQFGDVNPDGLTITEIERTGTVLAEISGMEDIDSKKNINQYIGSNYDKYVIVELDEGYSVFGLDSNGKAEVVNVEIMNEPKIITHMNEEGKIVEERMLVGFFLDKYSGQSIGINNTEKGLEPTLISGRESNEMISSDLDTVRRYDGKTRRSILSKYENLDNKLEMIIKKELASPEIEDFTQEDEIKELANRFDIPENKVIEKFGRYRNRGFNQAEAIKLMEEDYDFENRERKPRYEE